MTTITLIGTGHVFNLAEALEDSLDRISPETICVELDPQRYQALILRKTNPQAVEKARKNAPYIYRLLGDFQDNMAKEYGVKAGDEMLSAVTYGQNNQLPVHFIDKNAQHLFSSMLKQMSIKEKISLFFSGFAGLFVGKKKVEAELSNIDTNFDTYLEQISDKYPTIKRVLIDERNEHMVNHIIRLSENVDRLVAVLGDGHLPGMQKLLEEKTEHTINTIRLKELRAYTPIPKDVSTASFSINYQDYQ